MVKRNLIVLEKDIVSVIRHTGKLEYIKKEGEYEFPISVDFWNWWKKALSYLPDEDELDICFVYDKEYDLLSEEFYMNAKKVEKNESIWNVEYIKTFFWKMKPTYFSITLIGENKQEKNLSGPISNDASKKRFYTNLSFETEKREMISTVANDITEIDEEELSPIAKYFIDLIRKERGY